MAGEVRGYGLWVGHHVRFRFISRASAMLRLVLRLDRMRRS
jgi:hypothetical protein